MKDTDVIYKVVVVIASHILYIYIYIYIYWGRILRGLLTLILIKIESGSSRRRGNGITDNVLHALQVTGFVGV